jgi:hypothetical protein
VVPDLAAMPQQAGPRSTLLERIAEEPALVQLLVVVALGLLAALVGAHLVRRVREARERRGTRDYLLAVEQALCGDLPAAARRLETVVRDDPQNLTARLLQAEALTALGRPADAHREHLAVQRSCARPMPRNEIGLARALLAVGRAGEAAALVERRFGQRPRDPRALHLAFDAASATGRDAEAAELGAARAATLERGDARDAVVARTVAHAARAFDGALAAGERRAAERALAAARRAAGEADPTVARLAARWDRLRDALPAPAEAQAPDPALLPALPGLLRDPTVGADRAGLAALDQPSRILDAIEANRAHVQRLGAAFRAGEPGAADALAELGEGAVPELFAQALAAGPADRSGPALFAQLGPAAVGPLLDAFEAWRSTQRGLVRGRAVDVLARLLVAVGPGARPTLEARLGSVDRDLRRALVDFYLGLCDPEAFDVLADALPPVELVQRLNEVDEGLLVPFLACLPDGHIALEVLLQDGGFARDLAVLDAIPAACAPQALEALLLRRGCGRSLVAALIERIDDRALAPVARRLLDAAGPRARAALVLAFADLDAAPTRRAALADRLVAAGPAAVLPLCGCFGAGPTPLDAEVVAVLARIGDAAIPALRDAYRQGGLLERLAGPFARRRTHRREMLIRSLGALSSLAARTALAALRERETDPDLALRLAQALHRLDERGPRLAAPPDRTADAPSDARSADG